MRLAGNMPKVVMLCDGEILGDYVRIWKCTECRKTLSADEASEEVCRHCGSSSHYSIAARPIYREVRSPWYLLFMKYADLVQFIDLDGHYHKPHWMPPDGNSHDVLLLGILGGHFGLTRLTGKTTEAGDYADLLR